MADPKKQGPIANRKLRVHGRAPGAKTKKSRKRRVLAKIIRDERAERDRRYQVHNDSCSFLCTFFSQEGLNSLISLAYHS